MTDHTGDETANDPAPVPNLLGREGVDEDIEAVAHEADAPDGDAALADAGDEEMDDTNAGSDSTEP